MLEERCVARVREWVLQREFFGQRKVLEINHDKTLNIWRLKFNQIKHFIRYIVSERQYKLIIHNLKLIMYITPFDFTEHAFIY